MNIISFSLWGMDLKYCKGALRNCELAKEIYPNFVCRFYVDLLVPTIILYQLKSLGAEIIHKNIVGNFEGMFWRFEAVNDADIVLIRDCDSRLNEREKYCIEEWLKSDKGCHTIIDHPYHQYFIMPGLTGFKKDIIPNMKQLLKENINTKKNMYGNDYMFFESIKNDIEKNLLIHDGVFNRGRKIEIERKGYEFCGEIFDENNKPNEQHRKILENHLRR